MISRSKISVRYAETDKMGIVHHSVYPIWYEIARTDFCKNAGLSYSEMEKIGVMTPLIELGSKYYKPAYYEDELEVRVKIGKLGLARVEFNYEVYNIKENTLINTGVTVHALVGADMKPINVKKVYPHVWDIIANAIE